MCTINTKTIMNVSRSSKIIYTTTPIPAQHASLFPCDPCAPIAHQEPIQPPQVDDHHVEHPGCRATSPSRTEKGSQRPQEQIGASSTQKFPWITRFNSQWWSRDPTRPGLRCHLGVEVWGLTLGDEYPSAPYLVLSLASLEGELPPLGVCPSY